MNINNNEQIDRYLRNEMDKQESVAFELQLAQDSVLRDEVNMHRQIMEAATHAGIKEEFAKAMHQRTFTRRSVKWALLAAAAVFGCLVLYNSRQLIFPRKQTIENSLAEIKKQLPFINPPMPGINVPLSEYHFDAAKGTTIYHKSGSIIYFPASALVDAAGNPVKGTVKITYREFNDAVDFYLSGIPMSYDSAGIHYNFESSGMCEINAYKDNKPVFINKDSKPEIHLSGRNNSPLHNLYFLDTANRTWEFLGKDMITAVRNTGQQKTTANTSSISAEKTNIPVKPVKPARAEMDKQAFSIEIEAGSFEELMAYDQLKFQVEDENTYKRSDAEVLWKKVKLDRTATEGIYRITFSNASRTVSYKVRPVLEGADYDAALKVFKEKNATYELALQKRVTVEKNESDSINAVNQKIKEQLKTDQVVNRRMNELISLRNSSMRVLMQKQIDSLEKVIRANPAIDQQQLIALMERLEKEQIKYHADMSLSTEIIRSFTINRFGVWNCDNPNYFKVQQPLYAGFVNELNDTISLNALTVVYGGFNGILQFPSSQIQIIPGGQHMIWGIKDSSFYYYSYKDFTAANIDRNTKSFLFRMSTLTKPVSSYDEIRELVGKL